MINATRKPDYVVGLDLGQTQEFSAVAVLERSWRRDETADRLVSHYAVRHLHRWQLATPYPAIMADVAGLVATPPLDHPYLAVDQTGVGSAVLDMLRQARPKAILRPALITAGHAVSVDEAGVFHVAKKELVGVLQVLLGQRRLQIADLPLRELLAKELMSFKAKVTVAGDETLDSWRERDHDDLVLAVALAAWLGQRRAPPFESPPVVERPGRSWKERSSDRGAVRRRLFGLGHFY